MIGVLLLRCPSCLLQGPVGFYRRLRQLFAAPPPGAAPAPLLSEAEMVEKRVRDPDLASLRDTRFPADSILSHVDWGRE